MITVLFATRDRADGLPPVLAALAALHPPDGGWKLVVVDNGSQDATAAVLRRHAGGLPLTILHEPGAGKHRALNRAIQAIEGDLTVLTDDDIIPDPDWLVRLRHAAASRPEAAVFGGTIIPLWPSPRPAFVSEKAVNFSILYGQNERPTGWCDDGVIFGGNMAVRSRLFAAGAMFSEDIGPDVSRSAYVMGGEADFVQSVKGADRQAWFVAEARVRHIIRPEQLTEAWILNRYYQRGLQTRHEGRAIGTANLIARRMAFGTAAELARLAPPSWLRLRILSRDRFLAGCFAAGRGGSAVGH